MRDNFVAYSRYANAELESAYSSLYAAWSNFTSTCSWVPFERVTFLDGFAQYLEENNLDVIWIERIAEAFDQAGGKGHSLSNFTLSIYGSGRSAEELERLLDGKKLSDEEMEALQKYVGNDPELAGVVGKELIEQINTVGTGSDPEEIAEVTRLLNGLSGNGAISAEVLRGLGVDGLFEAMSIIPPNGSVGLEDLPTEYLEAMRSMFCSGESFIGLKKPDESRMFADEFADRLRGTDSSAADDPYIMSYLLRDSSLSEPFLGQLGNRLDRIEQEWNKTGGSWKDRSNGNTGGWFFDRDSVAGGGADVMAAYMSALGNNSMAAFNFFAGEGAANREDFLNPNEVNERHQYYFQNRSWVADNFTGIFSALDSAVTSFGGPEERSGKGRQAAALTSTALELLANRTRGKDEEGNEISFENDNDKILPGTLSPAASIHLSNIFGKYMQGVEYYVKHGGTVTNPIGETAPLDNIDPNGRVLQSPVFSKDTLEILAQAGLSTTEGFTAFRLATSNYQKERLEKVMALQESDPEKFKNTFKTQMALDARLEGFFMHNLGEIQIAEGMEKDEQRTAWIKMGAEIAKKIPLPGGVLIDMLSEALIDGAQESLNDTLNSYGEDAIEAAEKQRDRALAERNYEIVKMFLDNGMISPEDFRNAAVDRLTPEQTSEWLAGNFPTADEMLKNPDMSTLVTSLASLDMELYDPDDYRGIYAEEYPDPS